MSCELESELTAYLDGELEASRRNEVAAHLSGCASCRATLALLEQTVEAVGALPAFRPSPALRRKTMERLEPPSRGRGLLAALFRPVVFVPAGALAAGLVLALVLVHRPKPPDGLELQDPMQLEIARNLEMLDDLDVAGLEQPGDLEVIQHLDELEALP